MAEADTNSVNRVALRVPPFWPNDPTLWFSQLEGQFQICGITRDETKYWYVVAHLEPKYATEVKDIITSPPECEKYRTLKTELVSRLSASQEQKTRQLLEREELGDRKPSQFLRRLRDLGGDVISDALLRTLWMGRLPNNLQAILATQTDVHLDAVARLADTILETSPPAPVMAITPQNPPGYAELLIKIEELQQQISKLQFPSRSQYRRHPRDRSRRRSESRRSSSSNRVCYYHTKFGNEALKCIPPCNFVAGNSSGNATGSH